ncbi:tRNA pseudouridine(55) synthase TruB [Marinomonas agarivorans]|nr:tRNA pseudouridine(55) synthase TruB [Marinomonas agarivorans]
MTKKTWRQVDGIVLLNKPIGLSSNQALQKVRRLYQAEKAGHTGALDPLATGMLPLCFGEATKYSQFLLNADKRYITTIFLGKRTTTGDAEGNILTNEDVPSIKDSELEVLLERFRGSIEQIPPMYSALKYEGRPLYEYARQGIVIERKKRQVFIRNLSVIERTHNTLTLDISCSKGTYIRTIGEDIGEALGCGAHLQSLHRVSTAGYKSEDMLTLDKLEEVAEQGFSALDRYLLPIDTAVLHFNKVELTPLETQDLLYGRTLAKKTSLEVEQLVRIYTQTDNHFLGLGQIKAGAVKPHRLVNTSRLVRN